MFGGLLLASACFATPAGAATAPGASGKARGAPGTLTVGLPETVPTGPPTTAPPAAEAVPPAKAYVLVDLGTGRVLAAHNERLRLRPASLTKVLTALIAVTYLSPGATVAGTAQSAAAYPDDVGIEKGVHWPLEEVLQSLLVMSANDAAYALAQRISGSLGSFGAVMDRSARQIGMSDDPVFHDPAGLDGSEGVGGGNYVSARDLAIAGRDLLRVPRLAAIVKEPSYSFTDPTGVKHYLASTNYTFLVSEPGAIGVKTGFTDAAGSCVMGAATHHGRTMLAVVMNGYNPTQTAIDLLDQGFATPAGSEPQGDQLPAFALPHRPVPSVHLSHTSKATSRARDQAGRTAVDPPTAGGKRLAAGGKRLAAGGNGLTADGKRRAAGGRGGARSGGRPAATSGDGLTAVLGTFPGLLLVLAAATAGLAAAAEYVRLGRLNRARALKTSPSRRTAAWVTTLGGSSRHRDDLVASYARHEKRLR